MLTFAAPFADLVNVAVKVSASTCKKLLMVPRVVEMSDCVKPATASVNWKVRVVVAPALPPRPGLSVIATLGVLVSIIRDWFEDTPAFPATSVAVAVMSCVPGDRETFDKVQFPVPLAVTTPSVVEPSFTVTVRAESAASIVPLIEIVVALVMKSVLLDPLSGDTAVIAKEGAV